MQEWNGLLKPCIGFWMFILKKIGVVFLIYYPHFSSPFTLYIKLYILSTIL